MRLPSGWTWRVVLMRALLFLLPVACLLLALPQVPNWAVVVLVVMCALQWARSPDHLAGALALTLVIGWWTVRDVVDWQIVVVAVLLTLAHVIATVSAYGPVGMRPDRDVALLWLRRGALSLIPLGVTFAVIRGFDAASAPPGLWLLAAVVAIGLGLTTARLTGTESE